MDCKPRHSGQGLKAHKPAKLPSLYRYFTVKRYVWLALVALLVASGVVAGCATSAPRKWAVSKPLKVNARPPNTAGLSRQEIETAAKLCTAKCVRCHELYNPAAYSAHEWLSWRAKMTRKAQLRPEQAELLWRYLGEFRLQ